MLEIEIEREAVRLANVFGEKGLHRHSATILSRSHEVLRVFVICICADSSLPFDHVMAAAQRCFAMRAEIVDELRRVLRLQALVPGVVHHDDRRAIARAEAFDLEQRERPARVGLARPDAERLQISSVTRSAPFSAHDSVRQTSARSVPTGFV